MVWPCFNVFLLSKDNPTGHIERKKKKRQTEEEVGSQYQWTLSSSTKAAENRQRWRGVVVNSSVVPGDRPRLWDRVE